MEEIKIPAESIGPNRPMNSDTTPRNYQHKFDKKDICKRCGAEGWTKGNLCTGEK